MSAYNIKWIWDQQITAVQKLVLFALNEHCNPAHGDWRCFPSQKTLAKLTGLSDRTIRASMAELEKLGLIRVAHQYDGQRRQQNNMYWLNAPFIGAEADSARVEAVSAPLEANAPPGRKELPGGRWKELPTNPLIEEPLNRNPVVRGDLTVTSGSRKRAPAVLVSDVVDLYHEMLCPPLPKVEKLTDTRRGLIQQRWREDLSEIDHWRNFFAHVKQSDFLMGRTTSRDGRPPFRADLEWLTRPANFAKIAEDKYHAVR